MTPTSAVVPESVASGLHRVRLFRPTATTHRWRAVEYHKASSPGGDKRQRKPPPGKTTNAGQCAFTEDAPPACPSPPQGAGGLQPAACNGRATGSKCAMTMLPGKASIRLASPESCAANSPRTFFAVSRQPDCSAVPKEDAWCRRSRAQVCAWYAAACAKSLYA